MTTSSALLFVPGRLARVLIPQGVSSMRSRFRRAIGAALAAGVLLGAALPGGAQVVLKVDTTKPWQGFMNVWDLPDYNAQYRFGSAWGIGALTAYFTGTNTLTFIPNTNTYNPTDPFWVNPDGSGNKFMEANFYVENAALRGNTVTFSGTVISNNLVGGTSGHQVRAFVKTLDSGNGYQPVPGAFQFVDLPVSTTPYPFSITVAIPDGPTMVPQYGFVMTGPDVYPQAVATNGLIRIAVDNADPSIIQQPANRRVQVGTSAALNVGAVGGSTLSYQWMRYGTNLLNGGRFSGVTTSNLTIANAQLSDATVYTVKVTDTAGNATSDPATLRVKTAAEFANALDNPGFEDPLLDPDTMIPTPWFTFAGANYKTTNDFYGATPGTPVQTIDGATAGFAYNGGEYNGVFQDVAAAPGQIFTGDAWFYVSSLEPMIGNISGWLEIQFRNGGATISLYKSAAIDGTSPTETWMHLYATNGLAGDFITPIPNAFYLIAPPGTTTVRYQVTLHALAGSGGSLYYDAMSLMKKIPVTVSPSLGGGNVSLSWLTQAATSYQVVYKNNLSDAFWTPVGGVVAGDGTVKAASFPIAGGGRYYTVLTQ